MKRIWIVVLLHLLFWIQNLIRNLTFYGYYTDFEIVCDQLVLASICYINYFFFVPYILRKNSTRYYILGLVGFIFCFTVIYAIWTFLQTPLFGIQELDSPLYVWLISYNISFLYGAMSIGSRLAYDWTVNQEKNKALLLQKTTTQIQLIKSNVNMPFLLQVLNYAERISKDKPQQVEQPIMLLSDVLRYGLYESESLSVPLSKEIEIIEEYLSLQKLINPLVSTPLVANNASQHVLIVPNVLLRIISLWRTLLDKQQKHIHNPIHLDHDKSIVLLSLPVGMVNQSELYHLEKEIQNFNNDHLSIAYHYQDDTCQITISTLPL